MFRGEITPAFSQHLVYCVLQYLVCVLTCKHSSTSWSWETKLTDSSSVTGRGAECLPDWEISADLPGNKERKIEKGRWKIENGRRKSSKENEESTFFFFFCLLAFGFFFFFFLLFNCFGSTKMAIFYQAKSISLWKKNQEKWLPPRKFFLLRLRLINVWFSRN